MIKTLGPLEDASDLASIAPVLHHWADVITKADSHVSSAYCNYSCDCYYRYYKYYNYIIIYIVIIVLLLLLLLL